MGRSNTRYQLSRFVFGHVGPNGRVRLQDLDQVVEFVCCGQACRDFESSRQN